MGVVGTAAAGGAREHPAAAGPFRAKGQGAKGQGAKGLWCRPPFGQTSVHSPIKSLHLGGDWETQRVYL